MGIFIGELGGYVVTQGGVRHPRLCAEGCASLKKIWAMT